MNPPDFSSDLARIDSAFSAIASAYKSPWQRYIALCWLSKLYAVPPAQFRRAFQMWQVERLIAGEAAE